MKKLVLFAAVAFAISFASCGNTAKQDASKEAETVEKTEEKATEATEAAEAAEDSTIKTLEEAVKIAKETGNEEAIKAAEANLKAAEANLDSLKSGKAQETAK